MIAGTYTPFALVSLRGLWGWSIFGVIWGLALVGIVQEVWLAKGARIALADHLYTHGLACHGGGDAAVACAHARRLCLAGGGGACYTLGIVFYATDHKVRHGHGLWHLFVLGGSICHFFTVLLYVA